MLKKTARSVFWLLLISQMAFLDFLGATHTAPAVDFAHVKFVRKVCELIDEKYYDTSRIKPRKMLEEGFYELAKEIPEVLPKFSENELEINIGADSKKIPLGKLDSLDDMLVPAAQAFAFLDEHYKGDVEPADREYSFSAGMLSVLDPHSNMFPPKVFAEFKTHIDGEYGGLGIVIGIKDNDLTVIQPMEGTPAEHLGIKAGDKIRQIGGQSTTNMPISDAVDLMRGKPGTKVTIKLQTGKEAPRFATITREIIPIHSVSSKLVNEGDKNIGVIKIKSFQEDTYSDLLQNIMLLKKLSSDRLDGIVLDLRGNPGGLLDQAILVSDKFLESGDIVYTVGAGGEVFDVASAKRQDTDIYLPMIVIVDEGSASASEIVAGALKNNDRAIILGTRSFGKGSVQTPYPMGDGSVVKLTIAEYLTPGKVSIQAVGVSPDILVYPSLVTKDELDLHQDAHYGEEKLDAHLDGGDRVRQEKSLYHMSYLKTELNETDNEYSNKIDPSKDYPIRLSAKLLAATPAGDKKTMLTGMGKTLEAEGGVQDQAIVAALNQQGIDWSADANQTSLKPEFTLSTEFQDKVSKEIVQKLQAAHSYDVKITLHNAGTQPLSRVLGEVDAFNPLVNYKEFVFGKVGPGQDVSRTVTLKVPTEIIDFDEQAHIDLYSQNTGDQPVRQPLKTEFSEQTPPRFAYSYKIFDGNKAGSVGNGDGIPQPGEKIVMSVSLKNVGKGVSTKTTINLKNNEGDSVFLKEARADVGVVASGASVTRDLSFDVTPDFAKKKFTIDFFALDGDTRASLSDTLAFNYGPKPTADPKPDEWQSAPQIVISSDSQADGHYKITGDVRGDAGTIKDVSVFVEGHKLYYLNLEKSLNATNQPLDLDLPLVDGMNSVVIQARGSRGIVAQKNMSVVYRDPQGVAKK